MEHMARRSRKILSVLLGMPLAGDTAAASEGAGPQAEFIEEVIVTAQRSVQRAGCTDLGAANVRCPGDPQLYQVRVGMTC